MSRAQNRDASALVLGGVPRASLMPPEVAQGKREASRRRGLITLVVFVAILVAASVAGSYWVAAQAEAQLAAEREVTEQLLTEQLAYSEVLDVRRQLNDILDQRRQVTEREVLWLEVATPYLDIVSQDGVIESAVMTTAALADPELLRRDPIRTVPTATMIVTLYTEALPQPNTWLRAFERVETHGDASLDSITREGIGYLTTVTITLNEQALSGRIANEVSN